MMKKYAIHNRPTILWENGKYTTYIRKETVEVMATAGIYAMVRHKGAMPFVVPIKELDLIAK